jgi:hypothetical protein
MMMCKDIGPISVLARANEARGWEEKLRDRCSYMQWIEGNFHPQGREGVHGGSNGVVRKIRLVIKQTQTNKKTRFTPAPRHQRTVHRDHDPAINRSLTHRADEATYRYLDLLIVSRR